MAVHHVILLVVLGMFLSYAPAEAIQCYSCTYSSLTPGADQNCKDTFSSAGGAKTISKMGSMSCDVCTKIKTKFSNYETILRSCVSRMAVVGKIKCTSAEGGGAEVHSCYCDTAKCNNAMVYASSLLTTGLLAALARYIM